MLRRADPRAKLAVVSVISSLAIFSTGLLPLGVLALTSFLLLPLFGCSIVKTFDYLKGFITVMLALAVIQSIFTRGGAPMVQLGNIVVLTVSGAQAAGAFLLRMTIITLSAAILGSSTSREIIQGLVQMKVPYELAFMSSMGIRFLPVLRDQFRDVMVAMELRGLDFKSAGFRKKLQLLGDMFTPVVAGAVLTSRQISISIQLRGFRAFPQRSSHFSLRFTAVDMAIVLLSILFGAVFIYWYIIF